MSRARQKTRLQNVNSKEYENVASIYLDGKKDRTMVLAESGAKKARKEIIAEHITVLLEPGCKYLGHIVPPSGPVENIANGLFVFCVDKRIDVSKINSIGCDGTNTNVGWKSGAIKRLEEKLERLLHGIICQLHSNELPLRHSLIHLEGKTSGPCQFTGPIGKLLHDTEFEQHQIVDFEPIQANISADCITDLSSDQQYLLKLHRAVSSGSREPRFA